MPKPGSEDPGFTVAVPSGPNSVPADSARKPAVYDVSTHELRHHAFGGATALARSAHYRQTFRRDAP
jgi:hypothetical protein